MFGRETLVFYTSISSALTYVVSIQANDVGRMNLKSCDVGNVVIGIRYWRVVNLYICTNAML